MVVSLDDWMRGGPPSVGRDFSSTLAQSARWHARTAISSFISQDRDEQLQAACSAGTAVELLAKAYLADVNPALLADKGDKDTVLHLGGRGTLAKGDVLCMRTIGAYEALRLVAQLHRGFPPFDQQPPALTARNAALHTALADRAQLRAAVVQMARMTESLLEVMKLDRSHFWGEHAMPVADSLLDEAARELEQVIKAKLAVARARLAALTENLAEPVAEALLATLAQGPLPATGGWEEWGGVDHLEAQECPACHQRGMLFCELAPRDVDWEHDGDGGTFEVKDGAAFPLLFSCPVCRLELSADELGEFDFPDFIALPPDETGGWDEDIWRGER
jgi:hypothetical protein